MNHAHEKLPLGVMCFVEALYPDTELVSRKSCAFNGRDKCANIYAAR